MTRRAAAGLALLLLAGSAAAEELASTAYGGVGIAVREARGNPPDERVTFEFDDGTQLHLALASHYAEGLLFRVDYAYTLYDALTANGVPLVEDIEQHDARAGLFYAPWSRGPVRGRIGGGYVWWKEDQDAPAAETAQDGGYVEAGVTLGLGERLRLDVAGAALKLEGDGNYDAEGVEARAGLTVDVGPLDATLGAGYRRLQREGPFDEDVLEVRIGLGGAWGYPEHRW